jgi:outer membrane protein assembly factor BamD
VIVRPGVLAVLLIVFPSASEARDDVHRIADQTTVNPGKAFTAESEIAVARFYVGKGDYTGAINRCKVVVVHFPDSWEVQEALVLLVQSYLALGIPKEAQTATAVLNRKFSKSGWTDIAIEILKSAALEPEEDESSWISRAFK